jgi:hypothetical protein
VGKFLGLGCLQRPLEGENGEANFGAKRVASSESATGHYVSSLEHFIVPCRISSKALGFDNLGNSPLISF